jgi:hypothetical protein
MEKSIINQLILRIEESFQKLKIQILISDVEHIALFIYQGMAGNGRTFHTTEHVLQVCRHLEHPLQILATLFHDIIYHQIDNGIEKDTQVILSPLVYHQDNKTYIREDYPRDDIPLALCLEVFDYQPNDEIRIQGYNEFLSTLVAIQKLKAYLGHRNLLGIMVAIEGTIPFRGLNHDGQNCFEVMETKLLKLNQKYELNIKEEHIYLLLELAVEMANNDVENFSHSNVAEFLDNTWRLIPETNDSLRVANAYTLTSYRKAIEKMEGFLNFLSPSIVFQQYRQVPSNETFKQLKEHAEDNIKIAREYLQAKLTSVALLEALAVCTGGDAPISMFIGDIRHSGSFQAIERAEDYLPAITVSEELEYDEAVLRLLEFGRASELDFDTQNAPFSYFVYASIGKEKNQLYLQAARKMFKGEISCQEYLTQMDARTRTAIAQACAQVAISRREALLALMS